MISIAGGVYAERCRHPAWDQIFGSGLRAAIALSSVSDAVRLHAYVPTEWRDDIDLTLASFGVIGDLHGSKHPMTFKYLDTLQVTERPRIVEPSYPDLVIEDEVVLRFGMLEGDARITGDRVVYDPQSPTPFDKNGSTAGALALIVTGRELMSLVPALALNSIDDEPLRHMPDQEVLVAAVVAQSYLPRPPEVILVKDGLGGLLVFHGDQPTRIPSYAAESFFRIGSGDVTAAAFAYAWGQLRLDAVAAAHYAARCTAYFVEGPRLPLPTVAEVGNRVPSMPRRGEVRIVGVGDFELHALVVTTRSWVNYLGGTVRHVSFGVDDLGESVDEGVDLLLIGSRCSVRDLEAVSIVGLRPTVVFWTSADARASEYFPGAVVTSDYATALYHVMRSPER